MNDIGREYASALFSICLETCETEKIDGELSEIIGLFDENPEYMDFLMSPAIPKSERCDRLSELLSGKFSDTTVSFLCVMCKNSAIFCLSKAVSDFHKLYNTLISRRNVKITSAVELTNDEKERLINAIRKKYAGDIEAEFVIDPTIFGGIIMEIDGQITDDSLKNKLDKIKQSVSQGVII